MAKGKPATSGKTRIGSPITSPPLKWQWLQRSESKLASSSTAIGSNDRSDQQNSQVHILGSLKQSMREMFLPVGYPESVHSCYKRFHMWLGLETYVGSAIGVLCSQAMLSSLGLGAAEATGGAVAIQWVLKDGIGEFGKLFFIKQFASSFDSHPKSWKFVSTLKQKWKQYYEENKWTDQYH
ncbi:vitamin B6 photo-protection and homoeostasis-domain-containing protein [Phascolomyces articulosus]|uniref:Vitamin B6 photo-protection and homoeostasis-domain-containing protein n=1 Tax=Phascolomyces articulosus TaxID=60185 RepID=A0AAD5KII7_9FUNG|nr:vitamin B6 photo-protection and homoeostasis-domain-containing protein [Phascolomyces articulosus]